jgi:ADP-heptose:LPS heptosyltransferase
MSSGSLPGLDKSAGLLRWGGFGDMLMASIVFPYLKADGYHLTVYGTNRNMPVVRHNPYIDKRVEITDGSLEQPDWGPYWEECRANHDRWINFSGSIEDQLLKPEGFQSFEWSHNLRHQVCNVNYYDWTMMWAGYPGVKGQNVRMFYSNVEHMIMHRRMRKHGKYFKILWALSGSSPHKAWPYTEMLLRGLLRSRHDVVVYFVGDTVCDLLADRHWLADGDPEVMRRIKVYTGKLPIRQTLLMTEYVDLIVGPETGVMNAAGGLDVPKILFLSHSSHENLSKHWKNTTPLASCVDCYPCHQIHYTASSCVLDKQLETPICQVKIRPGRVAKAIDKYYEEWRSRK